MGRVSNDYYYAPTQTSGAAHPHMKKLFPPYIAGVKPHHIVNAERVILFA